MFELRRWELYCNINNIRVRSFILTGAPFAYKTTNISFRDPFSGNDGLEYVFAADNPDGFVVDLNRVTTERI